MSNLSLKEQLQALAIGSSSTTDELPAKKQTHIARPPHTKNSAPSTKPAKQKPAWLEHAQYGVELLRAYFPNCFKETKDMLPLKVGIKKDLVTYLSTRNEIVLGDKACMVSSLAYYVNSVAYHKSMIAGATRIDLEGQPAGVVTAEEAQYAADCRKSKLQKKQTPAHSNLVE